MIKRILSFGASLLLSVSSLFMFAPVMVRGAADSCTWTGAGDGVSFSDGANWSVCDNGGVPESGDALVFDASAVVFDTDTDLDNDIVGATFTSITFIEDTTNNDGVEITGEPFSLSGDIVADTYGLRLAQGVDVTVTANVDFGAVVIDAELNLGANTVDVSDDVNLYGVVSGTGGLSVLANGSLYMTEANTFSGAITTASGARINVDTDDSLGTSAGSTTIVDGARLNIQSLADGTEIDEPLILAGEGIYEDDAVINVSITNAGEAGSSEEKLSAGEAAEVTFTDVEFTADSTVYGQYNDTIKFEDAELGGNDVSLAKYARSVLVVNGETINYTPLNQEIEKGDDEFLNPNTAYPNETITVNGNTGSFVYLYGGTLKGSGTIEGSIYAYPGSTVAPGNSPGCLTTDGVNFSEPTFQVEIAGDEACDDYDQMQVTLADAEEEDNEDVFLFDPILSVEFTNDDYSPETGKEYVIIDNDGEDEVQGTFEGLAEGDTYEGSDGATFSISYEGGDGNDVVLTLLTAPEAPDTGANLGLSNPVMMLGVSTTVAGALYLTARRYAKVLAK